MKKTNEIENKEDILNRKITIYGKQHTVKEIILAIPEDLIDSFLEGLGEDLKQNGLL